MTSTPITTSAVDALCPNINCPHRHLLIRERTNSLQLTSQIKILEESRQSLNHKLTQLAAELRVVRSELQHTDTAANREATRRELLQKQLHEVQEEFNKQTNISQKNASAQIATIEQLQEERKLMVEQILQLQAALNEMVGLNERLQFALRSHDVNTNTFFHPMASTFNESPKNSVHHHHHHHNNYNNNNKSNNNNNNNNNNKSNNTSFSNNNNNMNNNINNPNIIVPLSRDHSLSNMQLPENIIFSPPINIFPLSNSSLIPLTNVQNSSNTSNIGEKNNYNKSNKSGSQINSECNYNESNNSNNNGYNNNNNNNNNYNNNYNYYNIDKNKELLLTSPNNSQQGVNGLVIHPMQSVVSELASLRTFVDSLGLK